MCTANTGADSWKGLGVIYHGASSVGIVRWVVILEQLKTQTVVERWAGRYMFS